MWAVLRWKIGSGTISGTKGANVGAMFGSFSRNQSSLDGGFGGSLGGGSLGERVTVVMNGGVGPALGSRGAVRVRRRWGQVAIRGGRVHGLGRGGRGGRIGGNGPTGGF